GAPDEPKPAPRKRDKEDEKAKSDKETAGEKTPGGETSSKDTPEDATTTPMTQKQVNDAAAYIRSLAQLRGRNVEWAEQAVRKAVSLSANDALKLGVIDYVAVNLPDLLKQMDRKKVIVQGQEKQLQTADAQTIEYRPDWRARLLAVITDPSIALLLMTIGIYGLIFEFSNPGIGVAGVLGGICLLLALYALQLLPVNYAGLALILLGIAFMAAEAFMPSFGVIGIGGVAAFVVGAVILIDTELPGYGIPLGLIVVLAGVSALLIATITGMALKARRRVVVGGEGRLIGGLAEIVDDRQGEYWALVQGETWRVTSATPLRRGQMVRIVARKGLVLEVAPAETKGE
ncbi:MAG: NfeD family protein, partial [Noviherbaspirillum sp.]